jgi:hypothetical protein
LGGQANSTLQAGICVAKKDTGVCNSGYLRENFGGVQAKAEEGARFDMLEAATYGESSRESGRQFSPISKLAASAAKRV